MPSTSPSAVGLIRLTALAALCALAALLAMPPQPRALATPLVNEDDDYIVSDDSDVSGDAVKDTIIAQPDGAGEPGSEPGRVEVRSGQDDEVLVTLVGKYDGDKFGHSAAIAGDLNLDGLDDLIVGAPADGFGAAYVFFGPFDATRPPEISAHSADYWFTSIYEDDFEFGDDVGRIFDHDDDGISDLRVAAKWTAPDGTDHTRTYIYSGISGQILHVLHGEIAEVIWNTLIGDVNQDGVVDAIDLYQIQLLFGTVDATMTQRDGDLNLDGVIDTADYAIASANLGTYDEQYAAAGASSGLITVQEGNCTVTYQQMPDGTLKWKGASCIHCSGGGCNGDDGDGGDGGDGGSGGSGGDGGEGGSGGDGGDPADPAPPCLSAQPHPEYTCVGSDVPVTVNYDTDRPCPIEWPPLPEDVACYVGSDGECIPPGVPVTGQSQTIRFLGPGSVSIRPTACGCTIDEPIAITAIVVDLDIDSDNNNGFDPPDGSAAEDAVEDIVNEPDHPGKVVLANLGDMDDDGVPDFADIGIGASRSFYPMVVSFSAPDSQTADVHLKFDYLAAAPSAVTVTNDEFGDPVYDTGPGNLRLWTKNGTESRSAADVINGGDFVAADVDYTPSELNADQGGPLILFVESVRPSATFADTTIRVELYVDGALTCVDTVRLTALPRVALRFRNTDSLQLANLELLPLYTDASSASGGLYGGSLSADGTTLFIGADRPNPNATSIPGQDLEHFVVSVRSGPASFLEPAQSTALITADAGPDSAYWNAGGGGVARAGGQDDGDWFDPDPGNLDPDGFDAEFEVILADKYDSAEPSIEWLEREAWELRGLMYGGQSSEWFSGRSVWRDGNVIYVENSLSAEEAADAYYDYLLDLVGPGSTVPLTAIARFVGEIHNLNESIVPGTGNRSDVGAYLGRHWGIVDQLTTDLEIEVYTLGVGFVIGGVFDLTRAGHVRFRASPDLENPVWPLWRKNWARGRWTEYDSIEVSLGRTRNIGPGQQSFTHAVEGIGPVTFKPDGVYGHSFLEVKDVISLERIRQLRAMASRSALPTVNKRFVLICTSRTKKMTGPLKAMMKQAPPTDAPNATRHLFRRNVNQDTYKEWVFSNNLSPADASTPAEFAEAVAGEWVAVPKSHVQELLGP